MKEGSESTLLVATFQSPFVNAGQWSLGTTLHMHII